MRNVIVLVIVLGIVGLVAGYFIFARYPVTNELIAVKDLFKAPDNLVGTIVSAVSQYDAIRRNILFVGGGGALLGLVLGIALSRRS